MVVGARTAHTDTHQFELRRDPLNAEVDPADACIECKAYKYPCFKRIQPTSRRKRNCLTCGNKACSFSNGPSERAPGGHTGAVGHGEHNHESDELVDELDEVDELDDDIESEDDGGEYKPAISQPRARKPTTPVPAPVPMTHAAPGPMPVPVPVPVPATAPVPIPATAPVPIPAPVPKPTPRAKTPPPRREPAEIDPDPEETLRLLESAGRGGFSKTGMASTAANIRWEKHRREKAERAEKMAKGAGTTKGVNKAKAAKAQQQQLQHLAAAAVQSAAAAGPSYSAAASRLDLATASRPIPQAPAHPPRTTAPTPLQQTLPFRPLPQDPAPIPNQHTSAPRPIPHTPAPPPPQATATPSGSTSPIHAGAPQYEPYSFATDGHALPNGNGEPSRKRKANEVERSPSEPEARHSLPTPDSQRIALAGDSSVDENNTTGDLSADRQALFANESLITKRRKRERQSCAYHLLGVRDPDARSWPAPNDAYYNIHRSLFESEPISKWQVSSPFDPPASFDAASDAGYDDESDASSVASGSSVIVDILRPSELDRVPFLSRLVTLEHDVTTIVSKVAKLRPELFAGASEDEKYLPSYMYKWVIVVLIVC